MAVQQNPWMPLAEPLGLAQPRLKNADIIFVVYTTFCLFVQFFNV